MRHYHTHLYQIKHSQNFIKSIQVAQSLINLTHLNKNDFVIEIGPGKGALTNSILKKVNKYIGVELDSKLFEDLVLKYHSENRIEFINADFLKYNLPLKEKYKVIGNIPFALTADIIRKLLDNTNPPVETYLILQKEAALRLITKEYENFFALQYKPFFTSKILKIIKRSEFIPVPSVDSMLIKITKFDSPLISFEDKSEYIRFISFCFLKWKINVKSVLKKFFTLKQLGIISREYKINFELKPSQITFEQWLILFELYKTLVNKEKKAILRYN